MAMISNSLPGFLFFNAIAIPTRSNAAKLENIPIVYSVPHPPPEYDSKYAIYAKKHSSRNGHILCSFFDRPCHHKKYTSTQ